MEKFNKFTYNPVFDLNEILYRKLTREILVEKIPFHIKLALRFGYEREYSTALEFDKKCNFCGKMTTNILIPYVLNINDECLDVCHICNELMVSWK